MAKSKITVRVKMDKRILRRFSMYDTFVKRRAMRSPIIFASLMTAFSVACFLLRHMDGAVILGCVLLGVGLMLPLAYLLTFLLSVSANAKAQKLPRYVYEVTLTGAEDGIFIRSLGAKEEQLTLKWAQMHAAHRTKGCIYLYAVPTKAFLLPDGQANASPDEVWKMIVDHMPKPKA